MARERYQLLFQHCADIVREWSMGVPVSEICREHAITEDTVIEVIAEEAPKWPRGATGPAEPVVLSEFDKKLRLALRKTCLEYDERRHYTGPFSAVSKQPVGVTGPTGPNDGWPELG